MLTAFSSRLFLCFTNWYPSTVCFSIFIYLFLLCIPLFSGHLFHLPAKCHREREHILIKTCIGEVWDFWRQNRQFVPTFPSYLRFIPTFQFPYDNYILYVKLQKQFKFGMEEKWMLNQCQPHKSLFIASLCEVTFQVEKTSSSGMMNSAGCSCSTFSFP